MQSLKRVSLIGEEHLQLANLITISINSSLS